MEDLSFWKEKFEICVYAKKLLDKVEYLNTKVRIYWPEKSRQKKRSV